MKLSMLAVVLQQPIARMDPAAAQWVRWFLFDFIRGQNAEHHRRWVRFWTRVWNRGGELRLYPIVEQSSRYRAMWMAKEERIFDAQDHFYNRNAMRDWIKTGACFGHWEASAGRLVFVPSSLSPEECSDDEIREFHDNAMTYLHSPQALQTLWPQMPAHLRNENLELVMEPPPGYE